MNPLRRLLYITAIFVFALTLIVVTGMSGWFAFGGVMLATPVLSLLIAIIAIPILLAIRDFLKRK